MIEEYAIVPVFVISLVFGCVAADWWKYTGSALMHGVYDSIAIAAAYFLAI